MDLNAGLQIRAVVFNPVSRWTFCSATTNGFMWQEKTQSLCHSVEKWCFKTQQTDPIIWLHRTNHFLLWRSSDSNREWHHSALCRFGSPGPCLLAWPAQPKMVTQIVICKENIIVGLFSLERWSFPVISSPSSSGLLPSSCCFIVTKCWLSSSGIFFKTSSLKCSEDV